MRPTKSPVATLGHPRTVLGAVLTSLCILSGGRRSQPVNTRFTEAAVEDEGWGTCYPIIVAFNVAPLWAHKEFKQSGSVCTTVWEVICRNELCLRGLDRSKKQNLNSSLIDLISFLF